MKYVRSGVEMFIYAAIGLLFGGVFFRQIVFSHFDLLLGDVCDARFNGVILEHWWQVFKGTAQWLSPTFFFPVKGVLGYSDAGFLNALPYSVLRFIGIEPFTSNQIILFALAAVGWVGAILFFRRCLKVSVFPAIVGATLFVFPNSMATTASMHTQLLTVYYIPYLAIGICVFLRNFAKVTFIGTVAGIFVAVIVPAIFYTTYCIGWFFLFFILLLSGVCCAWIMMHSDGKAIRQGLVWMLDNWRKILPYCVLSAICFIPILLTYIPVFRQFGGRGYQDTASMLPSLIDYVNVGPDNWLWGKTLYSAFAGIGSRPMSWELIKGAPACTLLVFLVFSAYFIYKTRRYRLTMAQDGTFKIVANGNEVDDAGKLAILAEVLSIAILLSWLLLVKIHGVSLWHLVVKLIPGAGGIRAAYRFQHVLAFPLAIVVAIGLHQSINYVTHIHSSVKRSIYLVAISVICLLLVVEQFNTGSIAKYSKQQQLDMLISIHHPPQRVKVFVLLPTEGSKKLPYEDQINAMVIAQKFGLYTINGTSAERPPGYGHIYDFSKAEYFVDLARWIKRYNLDSTRLYFLDIKTGSWVPAKNYYLYLFPPLLYQ